MHENLYWVSAEVLLLASTLPASPDLPPAEELRQRIVSALDRMVMEGRNRGVSDADLAEARYAYVAFIDEQILKSSWPGRSEWMSRPLQLLLYREYTAGENFFARMRGLLAAQNRPVSLEAYYLCVALGFRGAFGQTGNEQGAWSFLEAARAQLARQIPPPGEPSPHAKVLDRAAASRRQKTPVLAFIAAMFITVLAVVVGLHVALRAEIAHATEGLSMPPASSAR